MKKQHYPEPTVGAIVVNPEGKFLLIQSHKWRGNYVIPGGHVELGEILEDALKREIREETGHSILSRPAQLRKRVGDVGDD